VRYSFVGIHHNFVPHFDISVLQVILSNSFHDPCDLEVRGRDEDLFDEGGRLTRLLTS
jgi:hypothetical protein